MPTETDLVAVERHVRLGHENLRMQRSVLKKLTALGSPPLIAEQILERLATALRMHRAHLRAIRADLNRAERASPID
jgi:hypothetical protein